MRWLRLENHPVNPAEFIQQNGLRRTLLPGQRLIYDEHDGQWYVEYAEIEAPTFPLFEALHRKRYT